LRKKSQNLPTQNKDIYININVKKRNFISFKNFRRKLRINRELIGTEKMKQSLREAIAFTKLKNENLMHNYISHCIEDKQLYVFIDSIVLVIKYLI
jgi:hypothetical protein